jgi:hypothetical protein
MLPQDKRLREMIDVRLNQMVELLKDKAQCFSSVDDIIFDINKFNTILREVVVIVEIASEECEKIVMEEIKPEVKLEEAVKVMDKIVPFKLWSTLADGKTLPMLLSLTVTHINKEFGNDWTTKILKEIWKEGAFEKDP